MAINFPDSPSINDTYVVDDKTFVWTGDYWRVYTAASSIDTLVKDADNDTKVTVEQSADEDTVRIFTAGTERYSIASDGHIIPTANETYDLGSASNRFRDIYLSGTSINLGGVEISSDGTNLALPPISSVSGDFTVDTDTLHVDSTNNRVGVGTTNPATELDVVGNITVSGAVDGRDVASDGTKLDGIESGATADQTASEILTAIKTVDGTGSGLDADTVDGIDSSQFVRSDTSDTMNGTLTVTGGGVFVNAGGNIAMNRANATSSTTAGGLEFQIDGTTYASLHQPSAGTLEVDGNVEANNLSVAHINVGAGEGLGDSGEDIRVGGIRGALSSANGGNQLIHLFNNVNIGYPTGWGGQDAPQYGLSVYGAIDSGNPIIAGQMGSAMSSPTGDIILLFNEFWVNQGGITYSAGVFTVPIAGTYRITLNPFMHTSSGNFRLLIGINNAAPYLTTHYGHCYAISGSGYDTLCLDSVVYLSANSNIRFRLYSGQIYNSSGDRFNQFSIAKIA